MTNQTAPDDRSSSLHRRLTVALANAADRARLAEVIAGDLGAGGADGALTLVRSEDLWQAADGFAQERAADRAVLRARLDGVAARTMHDCDTARHQVEHLLGWRRTLLEGAEWATQIEAERLERLGTVEAARGVLDERRAEQRTAQQNLDRVLEQRNAVALAVEEADRELGEMVGTGMDESGLRRELEAAGRAVQEAQQVHATALARLEELQIEATGLEVRRETSQPADPTAPTNDDAAVTAVREALAELQAVMITGEVDQQALALSDAWADLMADLAHHDGPVDGPSEADLDAARRRVQAAAEKLSELDAAAAASAVTPAQREALDAAHTAVLLAEEQTGKRLGAANARRRLEEARTAERALLDQHGFGGYLDVVLTGGRSGATDPSQTIADREHHEASRALEALERANQVDPELVHLRSERTRLLGHVTEVLGVDPGDHVLALLRSHRPVSRSLQVPLVEALRDVGVQPIGVSLEAAALTFLDAHPLPDDDDETDPSTSDNERHIELAAIDARSAAVEGELDSAQADVDRTAEALQMAERSVSAFESELSTRAGEDLQRMERFDAAEQLRTQIESVATTLRRAEEEARQAVDGADQAVVSAEVVFDQAAGDVTDLNRRARKLAEELPIDQRPEGDPLGTLTILAERLQDHSEVLQPEIDQAEASVASASAELEEALAASQMAATSEDGPLPDDLDDGLQQILTAEPGDTLLVLDEPFIGVSEAAKPLLLETLRKGAAARQLVLLTEDPEVLGWAIELPVEEAMAVPADALLARVARPTDGAIAVAPAAKPATGSLDITSTTTAPDHEPEPTGHRWAGRR